MICLWVSHSHVLLHICNVVFSYQHKSIFNQLCTQAGTCIPIMATGRRRDFVISITANRKHSELPEFHQEKQFSFPHDERRKTVCDVLETSTEFEKL